MLRPPRRPGCRDRSPSSSPNSVFASRPARHGRSAPDGSRNCLGGRLVQPSPPTASLLRSGLFGPPHSAPRAPSLLDPDPSVSRPLAPLQACNCPHSSGSRACRDCRSLRLRTGRCSRRPLPAPRRSPGPSSTPRKRGAFESQTTSPSTLVFPSAPPPQGWHQVDLTCLAPSLRSDCRTFIATTSQSAPVPRIGTLAHRALRPWASPSRRPAGRHRPLHLAVRSETTSSPVPSQRLRRAHATYTPDTAKAAHRPLLDFERAHCARPLPAG